MPRYNMSPDEAVKLADYFAAVDGAGPWRTPGDTSGMAKLSELGDTHPDQLDSALKILVDNTTFCAKCHLIGDYSPGGAIRSTLAPDLAEVGRRIHPEFLRRWLANPKAILPYTAMTVNFPPTGGPPERGLFGGSSSKQLDAVTELLLQWNRYVKGRMSIRQLVPPAKEKESSGGGRQQ